MTGLSGEAESKSCFVGARFSLRLSWFHPEPKIHLPLGVVCAFSLMFCWIVLMESAFLRPSHVRVLPKSAMWMCVSMNPGRTVFPFRLSTLVFFPMRGLISVFLPTLRMQSSLMAMASACGFAGFMVKTLAFVRTKSANIKVHFKGLLCVRVHLSLSLPVLLFGFLSIAPLFNAGCIVFGWRGSQ